MSMRESGSDTWPRFAAFPGDNLDLGNVPEESDVDHDTEPPSWLSGAAAVGTGADPPDPDQGTEDEHQRQPSSADATVADDGTAAPGFSGTPLPGSGFGPAPADALGYDDGPGFDNAPGFDSPPGFGDAPDPGPGLGAGQGADAYGHPAAPGLSDPAEPAPGYGHAQQGDYAGEYPGQYASPYQGSGFGAAPAGNSFGPPSAGPVYGGAAAAAGYTVGQENGLGPRDQALPFQAQYPPPQQPKSRVTASLRAVRRRKPSSRRAARQGRQAQLTVARVEPWSVMKFSFVISLVAFIVLFVAVAVLYAVLSGLGVFDALQRTVQSITSSQSQSGFNLGHYLSASRVLGYTGLLGAVNVVLITAISTVGSVLYNITADLAGGVEVTLKETD